MISKSRELFGKLLMKRSFSNWLCCFSRCLRSILEKKGGPVYRLAHDTGGMTLSWAMVGNDMGKRKITWSEIKSLHAFKRDLGVVDHICIVIALQDGEALQLDEDMIGWLELLEMLPQYLPGCKPFPEWWPVVAFPPFETNMTLLYQSNASV